MRQCTLCKSNVKSTEERHAIGAIIKYYENYNRDIGNPTTRRKHLWCPECTNSFIRWQKEMLHD